MKRLFLCLIITIFYSCKTNHYLPKNIIGTFRQIRDDGVESNIDLTFSKTGFTLTDVADYLKMHNGGGKYLCCDTVAYGTWRIDNQHAILSLSTPQLTDTYIQDYIVEKTKPNTDSLYFFVSNPIEKNMGVMHKNIFYTIDLSTVGSDVGEAAFLKEFDKNKIVIANPGYAWVENFSISIYLKPEFDARNIAINPVKTRHYTVKERSSNVFIIDIPGLTYSYFSYLRLKEHLVAIISKNELIWDGVRYKRIN